MPMHFMSNLDNYFISRFFLVGIAEKCELIFIDNLLLGKEDQNKTP